MNEENEAQCIIDVDVTEDIQALDGPTATANFSAGTTETCEAKAG